MLDEAKKREKVANAVLGLAFATSAAQSPKDFVKTGHVESPGTALMQRTIGNLRRKPKNLDVGVVSQSARNRKMKTIKEFSKDFLNSLEERTLMRRAASKKSGTMPIPGAEGAARKDVSRAGFRRKGPIQEPKVEKSGTDVPIWVRTHKSPAEYAAHTAKHKHKEGDKTNVKALRKQFHQTGASKDSEVHDITVGSPKSKVKDPRQRARQFVGALKTVASKMKEKKGVATNTPTAISSSGKKKKRSEEEGAEQRGRIYKKLGMSERNPKTGVQMAKLKEGKTLSQFLEEASYIIEMRKEDKVAGKTKTPLKITHTRSYTTPGYIRSAEEGSGKKWKVTPSKTETHTTLTTNPKVSMARYRQGGQGGGREYGYKRHPHGGAAQWQDKPGAGRLRGKKKVPGEKKPEVGHITPAEKVAAKRRRATQQGTTGRSW